MIDDIVKSPIEEIVQDIKQKGELVVLMKFGSHMYGTDTPESDTDYKGIYIPKIEDVILDNVPKSSINVSTGDSEGKNGADDIDVEFFTLKGFMKLVDEGQVCALDMLFVNNEHVMEATPVWDEIRKNRPKLIHKKTTAFVGYCRKQTAKYGIKGGRLAEVKELREFLGKCAEDTSPTHRMGTLMTLLADWTSDREHIKMVEGEKPQRNIGGGGTKNPMANIYLEILGKKCGMTDKISTAIQMCDKMIDRYGDRAKLAEENQGVDWKALHHATRCCIEATELLETGNITLPFKEHWRSLLMDIKQGKLEYKDVATGLEAFMETVEIAKNKSELPDEPDKEWMNEFVVDNYLNETIEDAFDTAERMR